MARIRTVKPDFFRHEELQDLSQKHGLEIMLVFIGIWTQCDKEGSFLLNPRQLSLDILPFLKINMKKVLDVLGRHKYVLSYTKDGKVYGHIPTFKKHQMIFGSERKYPAKFPEFSGLCEDVLGQSLGIPRTLDLMDNGIKDKGNNGKVLPDKFKQVFDNARKYYPGSKLGLETEWKNFVKSNKPEIAGKLFDAIDDEKKHKEALLRAEIFCPQWKNFKVWINNRCWEQTFGEIASKPQNGFKSQTMPMPALRMPNENGEYND